MTRFKKLTRLVRTRGAAVAHDSFAIIVAWLAAFWLRFNFEMLPQQTLTLALNFVPFVLVLQAACNWYAGLYRGVWRFASIPDLIRIAKAVMAGVLLLTVLAFVAIRAEGLPRSVPFLYAMLLFALLTGDRLIYRILKDRRVTTVDTTRVLIVGCGAAGELLARDLTRHQNLGYLPVGFVDDNVLRQGQEIHGIRVHGPVDTLAQVARDTEAELIIIAIANIAAAQMRRIVAACEQTGLPFRTIPGLNELVSGDVSVAAVREVRIEDLLGREPVRLDLAICSGAIAGKTILVTGGGGSIGAELCRQIAKLGPARLIIAEHSEFNLYRITEELRARWRDLPLVPRLVNVADAPAFLRLCEETQPQRIFHAAAYKHVPLLEAQVHQAIINNVGGTLSVSKAAEAIGCEGLVVISTDKAVHPTNVMGRSKRLAELVAVARGAECSVPHTIVRFGNVLDSAGSVVPLFREQIARGGPVTLTHPEMTRYFMTIPEATQLIIEASALGDGGDVFVLDMGEPVPIRFLAEQMIQLSGKRLGEDVQIEVTGLRPGEKLYEELFYAEERPAPTRHRRILRADTRSMQVDMARVNALLHAAREGGAERALAGELMALIGQGAGESSLPGEDAQTLSASTESGSAGAERPVESSVDTAAQVAEAQAPGARAEVIDMRSPRPR